jgi:hypothetical protein
MYYDEKEAHRKKRPENYNFISSINETELYSG